MDSDRAKAHYLMAIKEQVGADDSSEYGVSFVDASVGAFYIGKFVDDPQRSHLRTLLARYPPAQLLLERGKLSQTTHQVLRNCVASRVGRDLLASKTEFLGASSALKLLSDYYGVGGDDDKTPYPSVLLEMCDDNDPLKLTTAKGFSSAVSAFGAIVWYLRRCLVESDLLTMGNLLKYESVLSSGSVGDSSSNVDDWWKGDRRMVLDGNALRNLNILPDETGAESSTTSLLATVDKCSTPFGKRLLSQWLCSPLCDPRAIEHRQRAVRFFFDSTTDFQTRISTLLKQLPDLERLLQKMHTFGSKHRADSHPDGRAILFESERYNKNKIKDLLSVLVAFENCFEISRLYEEEASKGESKERSSLLDSSMSKSRFPDLTDCLELVRRSFDVDKAKKSGVVVPIVGSDDDYDRAINRLNECENDLQSCLGRQRKQLQCKSINYVGTGKNRYQLEMPDEVARRVNDNYEFKGQRKGFKRFSTAEIADLFSQLQEAENERDQVTEDIMRRVFAKFDSKYSTWRSVVDRVASFDVLLSLALFAKSCDGDISMPIILEPKGNKAILEMTNGVHPCLAKQLGPGQYIPNDVTMNSAEAPVLLLTGPNMGGKSTLMRQVGLIVVLSQLGSFVPASSCRLTPVDRIFTRLGATDRIGAGQSTFHVELSETAAMLSSASAASLLMLDELGRGTSTHDGTAIAYAVLEELAEATTPKRVLFSTHYHSLVDDFKSHDAVSLKHMACLVENENDDDPTEEVVTFLYKMVDGNCPKSYGFYAAKLAGVPLEVVRNAHRRSKQLETVESTSSNLEVDRLISTVEKCLKTDRGLVEIRRIIGDIQPAK